MKEIIFAFSALFMGLFLFIAGIFFSNPDPQTIKGCLTAKMHQVELCPNSKNYVPLKSISPALIHTILISEDASFYAHKGFDWQEVRNSFMTNLQRGGFARGGSTITQQLVKNVFLSEEKSLIRKLREAILTNQIEEILNKQQILERYLNVIEFGPQIYGIKAAANHYFQKSPDQLHFLEAAYLAYLLPNPVNYSQSFRDQKLSPYGRKRILNLSHKLVLFRRISQSQFQAAKQLVDLFPWQSLDSYDVAQLTGEASSFSPPAPDVVIDEQTLTDEQRRALEELLLDEDIPEESETDDFQ